MAALTRVLQVIVAMVFRNNATYNALDSAYMLVCMSVSADYVY